MSGKACYRHPEAKAITRCYYCKKPICKTCRYHRAHHYFCSRRCYYLFWVQEARQYLRRHSWEIIWGWNTLLTVLLLAILLKPTGGKKPSASGAGQSVADSTQLTQIQKDSLAVLRPVTPPAVVTHREVVNRGIYAISLPVKRGWIVSVWHNAWPVQSQIIRQSTTLPIRIPLTLGKNVVRIQVEDGRQVVLTQILELTYKNEAVRALRRSVEQVATHAPFVALTFDGGSSAEGADSILTVLRRAGITVTLFLTGQFIERYPHLVRQIIADGHQVGNHTYSHPHLTTYAQNGRHNTLPEMTRTQFRHQLLRTDSLFFELTGHHMAPLWRAPFGEVNREILTWAAELGYLHIGWSPGLDTFDWVSDSTSPIYYTPEQTLHKILYRNSKPRDLRGKIILMHLGNHRKDPMFRMLPALLDSLHARGLQVVPVEMLLHPAS